MCSRPRSSDWICRARAAGRFSATRCAAFAAPLSAVVRQSHTRDNLLRLDRFRSRTSLEAASFFGRKVGKANAVYFVRFRPPLLIIKSLDASGGSVFLNLLGAAKGALIRAAASTPPFAAYSRFQSM